MRVSRHTLLGDDPASAGELAADLRALIDTPGDVREVVASTLQAVRRDGDRALGELTRQLDGVDIGTIGVRVPAEEIANAEKSLDAEARAALELARENVERVSKTQLLGGGDVSVAPGQRVRHRVLAVRRAGAYVPGGKTPYPSTVIMSTVPARIAGVEHMAVCTPPMDDGKVSPLILGACFMCGVDEVYRVGGAQAVAALAYGTESIESVDMIVGPGNVYVQEAKRQLVGSVGIDGIEGPSELMIIADANVDPEAVALDLAAQAEHGAGGLMVMASPDAKVLERVAEAVDAVASRYGSVEDGPLALVEVDSLGTAVSLANAIAPEHLEFSCRDAESLAGNVRAAGCVFIGYTGATAFGDYAAGSNHVLPTGGSARFQGPLSPTTFQRRMAVVSLTADAAGKLAPYVGKLALIEGYPVHAESVQVRSSTSGSHG